MKCPFKKAVKITNDYGISNKNIVAKIIHTDFAECDYMNCAAGLAEFGEFVGCKMMSGNRQL